MAKCARVKKRKNLRCFHAPNKKEKKKVFSADFFLLGVIEPLLNTLLIFFSDGHRSEQVFFIAERLFLLSKRAHV